MRFGRLWAALLPTACLLCGGDAGAMRNLCDGCAEAAPRLADPCRRCAAPILGGGECGACVREPPPWDRALGAARFERGIRRLVHGAKFEGRLAAAAALGDLLARAVVGAAMALPDAVVPVPLHPVRLRARGFNQAAEIARCACAGLDVPVATGFVRRIRDTAPQAGLGTPRARRANVRHAFEPRRRARVPAHVALVDDVMTTGATLRDAARALRRAGAKRIDVWVVARALVH